jgi:serine/threonine-protein kinase
MSAAHSDRNLLYGILALQMDFIGRDALIAAMQAWVFHKSTPLGEILLDQGALGSDTHALLEALVDRHVQMHGDASKSLAAVGSLGALGDDLGHIADPDLGASLALVSARQEEDIPTTCAPEGGQNQEADSLATPPPTAGTPLSSAAPSRLLDKMTAGRNLLYEEIGRGGMGVVLRGRDPDLGRDLAVKVLLPKHQGDAGLERRFVEEAQIAGQLQHPGVVPIYELGRFTDHRPYFTMKLIKGRTLAELLAERPDAGHDLPRYLGIFETVCQALAYAHAKGVIHRDLKPANIMVGSFGEVQVMDWGLAKVLVRSEPSDPEQTTAGSMIRTLRSGSTAEEEGHTGVVGTPAFMAPEQARGEMDQVDERADVFGLGAILCVILSGKPPYASGGDEALARAATANLGEAVARLDRCGAEAELVTLAKECLYAEWQGRPRNAGVVAARVTAYLAAVQQRLRAAEMARAAAQARAEEATKKAAAERRARRLLLGLATAVLLLVLAGGSGAWLWQQHRQARAAEAAQRRQEADAAVVQAIREARLLLSQARAAPLGDAGKLREALAALKAETVARTAEVSADVQQQAEDLAAELQQETRAVQRDRRLLAALLEVHGPREGPRFHTDERGMVMQLAEPSAGEQFAAAFHEWDPTFDVDALSTSEVAARLRARPITVRAEVIAALDEWASERRWQGLPQGKWRRLAELATALDDSPNSRHGELRLLMAQGTLEQERALGMLALALRPVPVPFDAGLGRDRQRLRRLAESIDVAKEPVLGLLSLARGLWVAGDDLLAERLLGAAVQARPHEVVLQHALGKLRAEQGRWREAVECFAAARALRPELGVNLARALVNDGRVGEGLALLACLTAQRADNPWLHFVHGIALYRQGRHKEAKTAFRQGLRLKPDYHQAHNDLGVILADHGQHKEAEAACRTALRLKPDYHLAHHNLGIALYRQGRYREAEVAFRDALRLKPDLPEAHFILGIALYRQGRYREAEAASRQAIRLKSDIPQAHVNLGIALSAQGRYQEAKTAFRQAIRLKPDLPEAHCNHGSSLHRQGRHKEAEAAYRTAIRLKPDFPFAHINLAIALNDQGRYQEAEAGCRQAIRLNPDIPEAQNNLGLALSGQGRHKEAEAALRQAIRLKPDYPEPYYNLGLALSGQGRHKEAEAALCQAIRLKPDYPKAYHSLGVALFAQGRSKEAEAAYHTAIRLKPDSKAYYNLGIALGWQGRYKEAEAAIRRAIRLKPDFPEAHCNLGHALRDQGRFGEALPFLSRGHALGSARPDWPHPSAAWVRQCQRLIELDRLLPAVLSGSVEPGSAVERLELASLCQMPCKRLHATAARFAADAFRADPKRAGDLQQQYRYNAACSAVLAAAGQADDARVLPDRVVLKLRRQAHRWLRADLALYARVAEQADARVGELVRRHLAHWRADADLASVRDKPGLAGLDGDERQQWQQLWQDVDALLRQVAPKK